MLPSTVHGVSSPLVPVPGRAQFQAAASKLPKSTVSPWMVIFRVWWVWKASAGATSDVIVPSVFTMPQGKDTLVQFCKSRVLAVAMCEPKT